MRKILGLEIDYWLVGGLYLALSSLNINLFSTTQLIISLDILLWFILAFGTWILTFLVTGILKRRFEKKFLDVPNERSSHTRPTPRGGGIGFVWLFLTFSGAAASRLWSLEFPIFILQFPLLALALIGLIDDRQDLSARIRYLSQMAVAAVSLIYGLVPIPWLPGGGQGFTIILGIIINIIFVTAFINFYNFMDGLDGLVASVTVIQLAFLALYLDYPALILLAVALVGFLQWNWSPAKIFMGDAGSTFLGAIVAIFLIAGSSPHLFDGQPNPVIFWSAIAVTFPLIGDAIYTIIRRLMRKENIFKAHRFHLYQRLQQSGWPHSRVALTYCAVTGVIAILVLQLDLIGSAIGAVMTLLGIGAGEWYLKRIGS
ncbi:MAG: glycosyltransferase family 4 protein [Cyanobacteria bacterium P01_G01_bin.54]